MGLPATTTSASDMGELLAAGTNAGADSCKFPPPPSPPPSPPIEDDDKPCFARASTTVCRILDQLTPFEAHKQCYQVDRSVGAERVLMSELSAGDIVLDGNPETLTASRVVVVQHKIESATTTNLLTLLHAEGSLTLTPDHMLLIDGGFAPARVARAGSLVQTPGETAFQLLRVEKTQGAVVNPITKTGTILAADKDGAPLIASTANEWIADIMFSNYAQFSLSYMLSAVLPVTVQSYYDNILEPLFNAAVPSLAKLKRSVPTTVVATACVFGDVLLSFGLAIFAVTKLIIAVAIAAYFLRSSK